MVPRSTRKNTVKRLIFLDIDGVLNSAPYMKSRPEAVKRMDHPDFDQHTLDPWAIAQLNRILAETGSAVALSSSWRLESSKVGEGALKNTERLMRLRGFNGRLWQATPDLAKLAGGVRGAEIDAWLNRHEHLGPFSFVILDDRDDMQPWNHRLVQTTWQNGLTPALASKAIEMLLEG